MNTCKVLKMDFCFRNTRLFNTRKRNLTCQEKAHCCLERGKRFTTQSSLREHQQIHTGARPYQCSYCGRTFTGRRQLPTHLGVHTAEKPYTLYYTL
ncbi:hypothetical protein NFI96_022064 [Prochilodus magdalenae]|nr:hypothetical protein NFI96_022064 [Prochilodus magdalenae]